MAMNPEEQFIILQQRVETLEKENRKQQKQINVLVAKLPKGQDGKTIESEGY